MGMRWQKGLQLKENFKILLISFLVLLYNYRHSGFALPSGIFGGGGYFGGFILVLISFFVFCCKSVSLIKSIIMT